MTKMIQIRNVPDQLHRRLKAKAARLGMSLSDYLLAEIRPLADRMTIDELAERLKGLPPVELEEEPAVTLRRLRAEA